MTQLKYQANPSLNTVGGDFSLSQHYGNLDTGSALDSGGGGAGSGMGGLGMASAGLQGLTGLMSLYNAYQQNKLMKKQFKASLADRNQNIANTAATTNLSLRNQASAAAQMFGNRAGSDGYNEYLKKNTVKVDGSPIKA